MMVLNRLLNSHNLKNNGSKYSINMNMKVVYYFIVYAELRYANAKLLPYVKRLYSAAP